MIWYAGFLIMAMVQTIIDTGTWAVLSSRTARWPNTVLSQTSWIDRTSGYWSRRMSIAWAPCGGRVVDEKLKCKGHVLMGQFGEHISAVAGWWEEVMSVWRDRGWELVLLSYVIAWVAVLYVGYILME